MTKYVALINSDNIVENVSLENDDYVLEPNEREVSSAAMNRGTFIPETGKYLPIKVFDSWVQSSEFEDEAEEVHRWDPPVARPAPDSDGDNTMWVWDEDTTSWVTV